MENPQIKKKITNKSKQLKQTVDYEDDQNIIQDCLKTIQGLYEMRFVQKISRPIDRKVKEDYIQKFQGKLQYLHAKLNKIRSDTAQKQNSQNGNLRGKSVMGSMTHQPGDWKKSIRSVQHRYAQVLLDGSFKHYKKVANIHGFSMKLQAINIQEWAVMCLDNMSGSQKCC